MIHAEDSGYEPPQGRLYIESDPSGFVSCDERGFGGRYTLSEDKENRYLVISDSKSL